MPPLPKEIHESSHCNYALGKHITEVPLESNSTSQHADSVLQISVGPALHCTSAIGCGNKSLFDTHLQANSCQEHGLGLFSFF